MSALRVTPSCAATALLLSRELALAALLGDDGALPEETGRLLARAEREHPECNGGLGPVDEATTRRPTRRARAAKREERERRKRERGPRH